MVCISCTYQRPLFSIRTFSKENTDSITGQIKSTKGYNYWSIKKMTRLGGYSKIIIMDSVRNKITTSYSKRNPLHIHDGNIRYYKKVCYYSASGEIEKITKYINQNHYRFSRKIIDKTIYYQNGKRIKSLHE